MVGFAKSTRPATIIVLSADSVESQGGKSFASVDDAVSAVIDAGFLSVRIEVVRDQMKDVQVWATTFVRDSMEIPGSVALPCAVAVVPLRDVKF